MPERVPDLQGYQVFIIQASMEYEDNRWMGYDRSGQLLRKASAGHQLTPHYGVEPFRASQQQADVVSVSALSIHQQNVDGAAKLTRRKPPQAMFPSPPKCFSHYVTSGMALLPPTAHSHNVNINTNVQYVSVTHGHGMSTIRQYTALVFLTIHRHNPSHKYFRPIKKVTPTVASVN